MVQFYNSKPFFLKKLKFQDFRDRREKRERAKEDLDASGKKKVSSGGKDHRSTADKKKTSYSSNSKKKKAALGLFPRLVFLIPDTRPSSRETFFEPLRDSVCSRETLRKEGEKRRHILKKTTISIKKHGEDEGTPPNVPCSLGAGP